MELWILSGALGISVVVHVLQWVWLCDERGQKKNLRAAYDAACKDRWDLQREKVERARALRAVK